MDLLEGYQIYKSVQGKEYDSVSQETKDLLKVFRKSLGDFTDKIFLERGFDNVPNGKGMWQNSGNFTKYMWNRYKLKGNEQSNLVIYFNASTHEGLYIAIGLIDDKLSEFEDENSDEIYQYLENECKKIECSGFARKNVGWGERLFAIRNKSDYDKVDYDCLLEKLKTVYSSTIDKFYISDASSIEIENTLDKNLSLQISLNQILYGPPGTGKTYHTIDKALQIIDGEVPNDREKAKARFEELKEVGQVEFVTFHQSYGYEEFVEGIKAIVPGKEGNDSDEMIYDVSPGIFRKISRRALSNYSSNSTDIFKVKSFELNAKSLNIQAKMIQDNENTYRVLKGSKIRKEEAPSFSQYNYSTLRNTVLKEAKLKEESEFYILQEDYCFQSMSAASSVILGRMSNGLRDWKEIINYDVNVKNTKNYLLIIDEINRGNISKIFGELITLIEESKRLGEKEEMKVTLPYSGEKFGVPKNLYIIGTMNTADRSIALMDTALRRRFEFIEMMPDYDVIREEVGDNGMMDGIDIASMLEKINRRIEYLYDRDHAIGHAYFLKVKDKLSLDSVMRNQVIPLLQEYFYDDWEKIQIVLGDHEGQGKEEHDKFVCSVQNSETDILGFNYDEVDEAEYSYSINETFTDEAYLEIYA